MATTDGKEDANCGFNCAEGQRHTDSDLSGRARRSRHVSANHQSPEEGDDNCSSQPVELSWHRRPLSCRVRLTAGQEQPRMVPGENASSNNM